MPGLFTSDEPTRFARVAVERGIDRYPEGLTYGVPGTLADLAAGDRVVVPLGRGDTPTSGYVVEILTDSDLDPDTVKLVARRDASAARLPGTLLQLARWISGYYCAPIGMTLNAMLPAAVKRNVGMVTRSLVDLAPAEAGTEGAPETAGATGPRRLPPKQRHVLEILGAMPAGRRPVELRALAEASGLGTTGPIRRLHERGLVTIVHRTAVEAAWREHAVDDRAPAQLTDEQRTVIDAVGSTLDGGFSAHLVHGVTGSGKTEVYIRLIEQVLERGRSALLLVPEIALTPQTGGRLLGRLAAARVAILHSGLTAAQRHHQWAMVAAGTARVVLGARSAVFAPVPDDALGLIIVDEEHDGSYKQDQVPRYHGRDVAVRRGQLAGCPVVLGSATPSLESWHNACNRGIYRLHTMPRRVPGMSLPRVIVVDFAEERRKRRDRRVHLLGPILEGALGETLRDGWQALLLLNRRGYASYLACPDHHCGWVLQCDHCDVTMVYHKHDRLPGPGEPPGFVQCHHCEREQRLPTTCPDCDKRISVFGLGTQRVEEELTRVFPALVTGTTLVRVDSDTMRSAGDFHDVLERFGAGTVRVLLGTQMIAKGLDFPGVRLVGVINADTAIHLPDFRATERTFQLVSQVAGRCGRSTDAGGIGRVIVQTFAPDTPAIQLAAAHDYRRFAEREIAERQALDLPPLTRMARVVVRDEDAAACLRTAREVADGLAEAAATPAVRVRGPSPCPIARIAGRHRQQVEVLAPDPATLQRTIARARSRGILRPGAAMAVDVDPIALL